MFSYKVIKMPHKLPTEGFDWVDDPQDMNASPEGWHEDRNNPKTTGNNADVSVEDHISMEKYWPSSDADMKFDSNWDSESEPKTPENTRASTTHLFYILNTMHDIFYNHGFTESAGNFQMLNFGKGGEEADSILATNLITTDENNAFFMSPPDGQRGILNLFIFDKSSPARDPSLESSIPIHELTHGLSGRLVGGAKNSHCVSAPEANGLGEGWSDIIAIMMGRTGNDTRDSDAVFGSWTSNEPNGIRSHPYSTNMQINPLTYSVFGSIDVEDGAYTIGTLWASILNEIYFNLVQKYGFSDNWHDAKQKSGNVMTLRLIISGLMLQPCNPTMLQARDAIIKADQVHFSNENSCELWRGFAKRGLGMDARKEGAVVIDGYKYKC